jgi:crotonobetainyl-CoA:carnitine CoA-transferase CaiB-like acyl-CoA transferase
MREAQYRERGMFQEATPPSGAPSVTLPAMVPVLSATPGRTTWAGPELGEHTEQVLRSELGLSLAEITQLRLSGAI